MGAGNQSGGGSLLGPVHFPVNPVIGSKAEVFDAELHAIQKGLAFLASSGWPAGHVVICADNQAALLALAANNQEGLEYARNALLIGPSHIRQ